ncbi:hypothetical protein ACINWC692_2876 [Acinetobacter baumannii WC-692]|nr:hypothetical protein ACINWC692_2876 [Acinetobacter baumannii WC-692]EXA59917.1 hypothetical protein J521_3382 [Acinetobacter baumannii 1035119]
MFITIAQCISPNDLITVSTPRVKYANSNLDFLSNFKLNVNQNLISDCYQIKK